MHFFTQAGLAAAALAGTVNALALPADFVWATDFHVVSVTELIFVTHIIEYRLLQTKE